MIAAYADDTCPKIARHDGKIAILASADAVDDHGFLLEPIAAYETAIKILAAIGDTHGEGAFSHAVDAIKFDVIDRPGAEPEGLIAFSIKGAPLSGTVTPMQIAEIAAAFTQASREIDGRPKRPRADR